MDTCGAAQDKRNNDIIATAISDDKVDLAGRDLDVEYVGLMQ